MPSFIFLKHICNTSVFPESGPLQCMKRGTKVVSRIRPISLQSNISNALEGIVYGKEIDHVSSGTNLDDCKADPFFNN